jgi:hypothetical protein
MIGITLTMVAMLHVPPSGCKKLQWFLAKYFRRSRRAGQKNSGKSVRPRRTGSTTRRACGIAER